MNNFGSDTLFLWDSVVAVVVQHPQTFFLNVAHILAGAWHGKVDAFSELSKMFRIHVLVESNAPFTWFTILSLLIDSRYRGGTAEIII